MEEIIKLINAQGFYINNLFQVDAEFWRCNLREGDNGSFFSFANGKTAKEALEGALASIKPRVKNEPEDFSDILG